MMKKILSALIAGCLSALICGEASAVSTVTPTVPAQGAPLSSAVVRNNFAATYNDINNVLSKFANGVAPVNPSPMQDWVDTSGSPSYVFKIWNPTTTSWISWATLNINTGVFAVVPSSGSFAATAPLTVNVVGTTTTYGINLDSNFAVAGGALALNPVGSGFLIANCGAGSAEPVGCSWSSFADRVVGSTNGFLPYRTGGAWGSISTGTSGATIPLLSTANTWTNPQTVTASLTTLPAAQTGTLVRAAALGGVVARYEADGYGANGVYTCVRADGTILSPTTLVANDIICSLSGHGYDGTGYAATGSAAVTITADGTWSGTSHPARIDFYTTPSASVTPSVAMSLSSTGLLSVGSILSTGNLNGVTVTASSAATITIGSGSTLFVGCCTNTLALNGGSFTLNASAGGATLTVGSGKTATINNTLTFAGTDGTTMTFPGASDTVVTLAATQTLTNKTLTSPVLTTPNIGVANGSSLALGTSIGTNTLALTGTSLLGGAVTIAMGFDNITYETVTGASGNGRLINSIDSSGNIHFRAQNSATLNLGANSADSLSVATTGVTITNGFTATGLVGFSSLATAAVATTAQYIAATANTVVPASVVFTSETTTTFGATTSFDFSTFLNTAVTLTGNITTMNVSNVKAGQAGTITFIQDATGSRTTVWNSVFKFASGVAPALSTTSNAVDVLTYTCRSATFCAASLLKQVQ